MQSEMDSIYSNDVQCMGTRRATPRLQTSSKQMGFKRKITADGSVDRYKARLVAQGFYQRSGRDYDETFSPVIRFELLRNLIAVAVQKDLQLHQLDITAAF